MIAAGVVAMTGVVILIWGLSVTSGVVELVTFVAGLIGWALVRPADGATEARVSGIRSEQGSVNIRQRAHLTSASRVSARGDIKLRQEDQQRD